MLKGEASIISVSTPTGGTGNGAISTYNAIVIQGSDFTATDNQGVFQLDLDSTTADPTNHFNACPADLVANIRAEGATDPFTGGTIHNELTLIPCTEIFEQGVRPRFNVNMLITDEMEHTVSQLVPIDCMLNQRLDALSQQLGFPGTFGSAVGDFLKVRIKPPLNTRICLSGANACTLANFFANPPTANCNCTTDADCGTGQVLAPDGTALGCRPSPMVLGVVEEFQDGNGTFTGTTHEAANLHQEGQHPGDIMIFPFGTGGTP